MPNYNKVILMGNLTRDPECPIVYWDDDQVWDFIRFHNIPYCSLYTEQDRIGCLLCPLKSKKQQQEDAVRWPRFAENWKKACRKYWETHHTQQLNGKMNFCAQFKTWEAFWDWWTTERLPDPFREDCQSGMLWTNQELD